MRITDSRTWKTRFFPWTRSNISAIYSRVRPVLRKHLNILRQKHFIVIMSAGERASQPWAPGIRLKSPTVLQLVAAEMRDQFLGDHLKMALAVFSGATDAEDYVPRPGVDVFL